MSEGEPAKARRLEHELISTKEKFNKELLSVNDEMYKLRSELEESRARRHELELELAKRERRESQQAEEYENLESYKKGTKLALETKISQLSKTCREWKSTLTTLQESHRNQLQDSKILLTQKEEHCITLQQDLNQCQHKLETACEEIQQVSSSLETAESDNLAYQEANRSLSVQLEAQECELHTSREEILALRDELKRTNQLFESEKKLYDESKCSNEILSIKVKEFEKLLDKEKDISREYRDILEDSQKYRRELKEKRDTDVQICHELNKKLLRYEADISSLKNSLAEKDTVAAKLSESLSIHQEKFNELRLELDETKRYQIALDTQYSKQMNQIEIAIQTYQRDLHTSPSKSKEIADRVKHLLNGYHSVVRNCKEELHKLKESNASLSVEYRTFKELMEINSITMREAESKLRAQEEQTSRLKIDLNEREECLDKQTRKLEKDKRCLSQVKEELVDSNHSHKLETESHIRFLYNLYDMLLHANERGDVIAGTDLFNSDSASWSHLSPMITEQMKAKLELNKELREQVKREKHEKTSVVAKLLQIQSLYDNAAGKCNQLEQQLDEILQERQSLEAEIVSRGEESVLSYNEVKNREEQLISNIHEQEDKLQSQNEDLNGLYEALSRRDQELAILLACNALLISTLVPLLENNSILIGQKQLLIHEFNRLDKLRKQVSVFVNNMKTATISRFNQSSLVLHSPKMRVRKVVIAVILINRLKRSLRNRKENKLLSISTLCTSNVEMISGTVGSKASLNKVDELYCWLTSSGLKESILKCMAEVYSFIRYKQDDNTLQNSSVSPTSAPYLHMHASINKSITALLREITVFFPNSALIVPQLDARYAVCNGYSHSYSPSLIDLLCGGLPSDSRKWSNFIPTEALSKRLEINFIGLVSSLRDTELQKNNLENALNALKREESQLREACEQTLQMEHTVNSLSEELRSQIPKDVYENICQDLREATEREQDTQEKLSAQSAKIQDLKSRLHQSSLNIQERENTLKQSLHSLSQAQQDTNRADQNSRLSERRLSQFQSNSQETQKELKDTQISLRAAARERDTLLKYLNYANRIFVEAKSKLQLSAHTNETVDLHKLMAPSTELLKSMDGQVSAFHLDSCHETVKNFLEYYQYSLGRIAYLHSQLIQAQSHAAILKQEVAAATRRQLAEAALSIDNPSRHSIYSIPANNNLSTTGSNLCYSSNTESPNANNMMRSPSQATDTLSFAPLKSSPINTILRNDTPLSQPDTYFRPINNSPTPFEQSQLLGQNIADSFNDDDMNSQ